MVTQQLTLTEMQKAVHEALRAYESQRPIHTFDNLLCFQEEQKTAGSGSSAGQIAAHRILNQALKDLKEVDSQAAWLIDARFFAGLEQEDLAAESGMSVHAFKRRQKKALAHLAEIVLQREQALRWERQQKVEAETRLPESSYTRLFGVEADLATIAQQLTSPDGPALVVITGLGGIGKTALADAVTRQLIGAFYFDKIVWLDFDPDAVAGLLPGERREVFTGNLAARACPLLPQDAPPAEQQRQLRLTLKSLRCLVVVDNLETPEDFSALAPDLQGLANPSRFLLTSRAVAAGETAAYYHRLTELSQPEATALLRLRAQQMGQANLADRLQAAAPVIYSVVGGNPLALKLVADLAAQLPLDGLLADLKAVRLEDTQRLYNRIFMNVWRTLDAACQSVLSAMLLVAEEGATLEHVQAAAGLEPGAILQPLTTLLRRSLLENRAPAGSPPRYAMHRLTRSFILSDIVGWPEA